MIEINKTFAIDDKHRIRVNEIRIFLEDGVLKREYELEVLPRFWQNGREVFNHIETEENLKKIDEKSLIIKLGQEYKETNIYSQYALCNCIKNEHEDFFDIDHPLKRLETKWYMLYFLDDYQMIYYTFKHKLEGTYAVCEIHYEDVKSCEIKYNEQMRQIVVRIYLNREDDNVGEIQCGNDLEAAQDIRDAVENVIINRTCSFKIIDNIRE